MPLDPAALPLLLAGPILRRVEADLVSVWIATSRACNAVLLLFDGGDVVGSRTEDEDQRATWVSAPQPTRQIGANLHVLTVVLDLRTPGGNAARSAGATLQANQIFSYDLKLFERADPARPKNLRALELLEGSAPLGYEPGELPSFRTCPQELDQLVPSPLFRSTARGRSIHRRESVHSADVRPSYDAAQAGVAERAAFTRVSSPRRQTG